MYLSRSLAAVRAHFLSCEGRIDRMTFLRRYAALYGVVFVVAVAALLATLNSAMHDSYGLLISATAGLLVLIGGVPLVVQRFHDFGASGELAAVYYIVGLIIGVARAEALHAEMARLSAVLGYTVGLGDMGGWLPLWCLPGIAWMMVPLLMPGQAETNRYGIAADEGGRQGRSKDNLIVPGTIRFPAG